jgi:tetratricopeptide (TPR) repeat protein
MAYSLDEIGILEGTDKTSLGQNYLHVYERLFAPFRHDPIELLELGIANGGSLRTWQRYFSAARIIGVDINRSCKAYAGERIMVHIGSQADPKLLATLAATYHPTVIIDDGSHRPEHIFVSFQHLFAALKAGGYYVIEDLHLHFGAHAPAWHTAGGPAPASYFGEMAVALCAELQPHDAATAFRTVCNAIDRIEFYQRAVVIHKKPEADLSDQRLERLWELAEQGGHGMIWWSLAATLIKAHRFDRAEIAARRAIELKPGKADYLARLAHIQSLQGRLAEAMDTAREAVSIAPGNQGIKTFTARLAAQLEARPGI